MIWSQQVSFQSHGVREALSYFTACCIRQTTSVLWALGTWWKLIGSKEELGLPHQLADEYRPYSSYFLVLKLFLTNPGQLVAQSSIRQCVAVVIVNTYCQVDRSRITHKTDTWAYLQGSVLTGLNEIGGFTLNTNYTFHRLGSWTEDTGNHEGTSVHPPASCRRQYDQLPMVLLPLLPSHNCALRTLS